MKVAVLLISTLMAGTTGAQTVTELDPVTISANAGSQLSSTSGRNITVVKGEAFQLLPVHSLDELLRYVPGIEVQQRGVMGAQSDIVIRGGTFQQVLIILDGVRLNDPVTGHFNSYVPVAPAEIDRIEIVKGASSAVYGSEAVGGVIYVITKSFAAKDKQIKKQLSIAGTGGEYKLWSVDAGGLYQHSHTMIAGGIVTNNTDGPLQRGTRGFANNTTASLSFSQYLGNNWKVAVRSSFDKRRFSAQNFYTTYTSDTAKEEVATGWNQLQLSYQHKKEKLTLNAGYKYAKDDYAFSSAASPNRNQSKLAQAALAYDHRFNKTAGIITGAQWQDRRITSNDRGNHNIKEWAAFVIYNQNVGNLFISPALRLDDDERGGTELIPQLNASYKCKDIQLRGSAGKTIRQADFTERYNNYNKTLVTSGSIGNPDLEAETSFSYETGIDYYVNKALKISATAFRRDQEHVIDWTPTPYANMPRKTNLSPMGNYALAGNIAKVQVSGIETELHFTKQVKKDQVTASAGITWLDTKTSEAVPSFYISSAAKFLANFNLAWTSKHFMISTSGVYKHRSAQKATAINAAIDADCFRMNLRGQVYIGKSKVSLMAEVDNVLDNHSADLLGAKLPRRWTMGGLRWSL